MIELFQDIASAMKMNKRRSIFSGIATAWGIFIFIVILGVSQSVVQGTHSNQKHLEQEMLWLIPNVTSISYEGEAEKRKITLNEKDMNFLASQFQDEITGVYPMIKRETICSHINSSTSTTLSGVIPGYMISTYVHLLLGRDITELDQREGRKVCVLPQRIASQLFSDKPQNALGQYVLLDKIPFKVIGTYEPIHALVMVDDIYIPLSTSKALWRKKGEYDCVSLFLKKIKTKKECRMLKKKVYKTLAYYKKFDVSDASAIYLDENIEFILLEKNFLNIFYQICVIVGILSLALGVIGVSSTMLISVKERMYEMALRRVLGASNVSIISLVLIEAVASMLLFGYIGLVMGIGLTHFLSIIVEQTLNVGAEFIVFGSMEVGFAEVLKASSILVIGGIIAGYGPARYAIRMRLNEILNS